MKNKIQFKMGISLIVLVITVIVMIIIAGTIIISLSNNDVVTKANDAVGQTNIQQIKELVKLAWTEAYMMKLDTPEDRTEQYFIDAVNKALEKNNITEEDYVGYDLQVTVKGAELVSKENIKYEDFIITSENKHKIGVVGELDEESGFLNTDIGELIIPETFYDEEDKKWYKVIAVGWGALAGCYGFTTVKLPTSIAKIEGWSFSETDLTEIVIPNGITTIKEYTFYNSLLERITIPKTVISIGESAFEAAYVKEITYTGTKAQWDAIEFGENWIPEHEYESDDEIVIHCTDGDVILENTIVDE